MATKCNLPSRRDILANACAGYLGIGLSTLWQAQAAQAATVAPKLLDRPSPPPIRACIFIFYYGGPSHLDTYDPKPQAPAEVRGEFKAVATDVPGIHISEHLPCMSRRMGKVALIRSMSHQARLHDSASIHALTGRPLDGPDRELFDPLPQMYPSFGGVVSHQWRQRGLTVPHAALPFVFRNVHQVPCQGAGFLGTAYNPLQIQVDPLQKEYRLGAIDPLPDVPVARQAARRHLLSSINARHWLSGPAVATNQVMTERANELLDSRALREALDLTRESDDVRNRYGFDTPPVAVGEGGGGGNGAELGFARQMRGQNLLVARRLVQAGVPFVNVYDFQQQGQNWDAHFKCFSQHKNYLLPIADQSLAALLDDLEDHGLLESTLVVATGEFGRTPTINGDGGRDHWPDCYTTLLAGGGVTGGAVYGASDRLGAYPALDPVTPSDLAATIFWRFGLNPHAEVFDSLRRPHRLADGRPLDALFS